ncbi:MAG: hypothetical protein HYT11_03185 [Candidatus Levybacteria bacterium]|nr:hypothetical protein [Candidatus Levybacteria bacterium]
MNPERNTPERLDRRTLLKFGAASLGLVAIGIAATFASCEEKKIEVTPVRLPPAEVKTPQNKTDRRFKN